ncbi:hypothetical protein RFI_04812 [Reticulomyxa filosa]|uniref:Uncharacterized protein n=1 Tax=Reticulomyxa filosa TaxID=46433 RepID=X6P2D5_RETFI|nr:hypothetical protein RFI_04812 [Reticulomyxa filosa]|eukprot:ETO32303.1 hypothetical protein RFI_04812 [Reticulomyxa filosa]
MLNYRDTVVKLVDKDNNKDNNKITLLSFGGDYNHTLMMKYISVWSDISNKSNELNNYNQWIPFTDNHNHSIIIGRDNDNYTVVIGGEAIICYLLLILLILVYLI